MLIAVITNMLFTCLLSYQYMIVGYIHIINSYQY